MTIDASEGPRLRLARIEDAAAITRITNAAYVVEDFFKVGERTDENEIVDLLQRDPFIVVEDPASIVAGSVHLEVRDTLGYFGMLAVEPGAQRRGLGRRLIAAAERYCAQRRCATMRLDVVNLRTSLIGWYASLGYVSVGVAPFPEGKSRLPCQFVVMQKPLALSAVELQEVAP